MIIGFDGSRAFGQNRTGTENYSYQLLKALLKIDKKNKYIIYDRASIPLPRLWTQVGLAYRTFIDPLDVLFIPSHTLPLIRRRGLKTVITVHDLGSQYLPSMHQIKQRLYLSLMTKLQLKTATKIISVSKATKVDLIDKIGIDSSKITVVHEGFNQKLFKLDTQSNSVRDYYLFVGTVQPRKNLERVIQAFANILSLRDHEVAKQSSTEMNKFFPSEINKIATPANRRVRNDDIELVIAGSKGWLSDDIYKLPKKLGIEDRVKFLGYVPDKDLPVLYKGAIALIFPSLFEGFGLPILEAQASGCPVITSNISSMPEVAGKAAIFVNPYNIDDIRNAMIEVGSKREKWVKAGLENIKRFSWEKCARETLEVLENA